MIRWTMILAALAGLFGAAGVAAAALAAHRVDDATLRTAADFLLFHAAALLAIVALARGGRRGGRRGLLVAGTLIAAGTLLFCGDLAMRALAGVRLVPMAAPIGGLLLIAGWLASAATAPLLLREVEVS